MALSPYLKVSELLLSPTQERWFTFHSQRLPQDLRRTTSSGRTLVWVDRQGKEEALGAEPEGYSGLKISPDGTRVALTIGTTGNQDIWIWDIPHKTPTKLTFDKADDSAPIWTPDGKRIVFTSLRGGGLGGVYWKSADGIGEDELLASKPDRLIIPWSFSRDGKILAVTEISLAPLGFDIGMLSMEGKREIKELLQEKYMEAEPQISPDGRYVAYQSDESGKGEIYVRSFPDVNKGKWQVSSSGGNSPLWSPDGRELFYRSGDATMAVEVETEPTFKRGNPKILFRGTYFSSTAPKDCNNSMGHPPQRQEVPDDKASRLDGCSPHSSKPTQNQHRGIMESLKIQMGRGVFSAWDKPWCPSLCHYFLIVTFSR